ncbi:MAG: hypothetical protein IJ783_03710 [Kiritimatiellae bacterium]|nr:hypothetical protein [Kiritimatiellia bacterium]
MKWDFDAPERAPLGAPRPDGRPWLSKEQILDLLDQTLCLRDKARVQRTPEDAARKCMLCWLADRIGNELEIEAAPGNAGGQRYSAFSRLRILYRNPNFPWGQGAMHSGVRDCDWKTRNSGFDENSWKRPRIGQSDQKSLHYFPLDGGPYCSDGAYEIALEYWTRITASAWIDMPEEPPILPSDESERWVLFEKGSDGRYDDIVFLPPAMSHLEWERKCCGTSLGDYVKTHVGEFHRRWLSGIDYKTECDLNGLELARKFNTTDPAVKYPSSYRIWFQREDGRREQFPGVYYPSLGVWKKKRLGEWIRIGRRIDFWLGLEKSGDIHRDPARESRFRKLSGQIASFVDGSGPEPEDDIDLDEAIPQNEQAVIDRMIDDFVKQTVAGMMKTMFPVNMSEKSGPDGSNASNPGKAKESAP